MIEWPEHGIRLNCIGADAIESIGFNNQREENVATFYACNPMDRAGEVLNVEGGMLLWGELWPAGKPDYFRIEQT